MPCVYKHTGTAHSRGAHARAGEQQERGTERGRRAMTEHERWIERFRQVFDAREATEEELDEVSEHSASGVERLRVGAPGQTDAAVLGQPNAARPGQPVALVECRRCHSRTIVRADLVPRWRCSTWRGGDDGWWCGGRRPLRLHTFTLDEYGRLPDLSAHLALASATTGTYDPTPGGENGDGPVPTHRDDPRQRDRELVPHPSGIGWSCPGCGEARRVFFGLAPTPEHPDSRRLCASCTRREHELDP